MIKQLQGTGSAGSLAAPNRRVRSKAVKDRQKLATGFAGVAPVAPRGHKFAGSCAARSPASAEMNASTALRASDAFWTRAKRTPLARPSVMRPSGLPRSETAYVLRLP